MKAEPVISLQSLPVSGIMCIYKEYTNQICITHFTDTQPKSM